ncbi:MAG: YigZ family protein [Oscillospiraceae bacterium]|nr:YigZ family protein [Oscillospiraceae bacterium]
MEDGYKTLRKSGAAELTEKRSKFIAAAAPVSAEAQALSFLASVRAAHRQASHNVYAYALREDNLQRYSDDGEPQGTAGLPVLDVLSRGGLTDAVIVVTRYFEGTLLGTGGLVRAYGEAAARAVAAAGVVVLEVCAVYEVTCAYAEYDRLQRLLAELGARVEQSEFTDAVRLQVALRRELGPALAAQVTELTRGQSTPRLLCEKYADVARSAAPADS